MRLNSRIFFVYRFVAAANLSAQHSVSIFVPAILFPVKRGLVSLNFFFGKATKNQPVTQEHSPQQAEVYRFILRLSLATDAQPPDSTVG